MARKSKNCRRRRLLAMQARTRESSVSIVRLNDTKCPRMLALYGPERALSLVHAPAPLSANPLVYSFLLLSPVSISYPTPPPTINAYEKARCARPRLASFQLDRSSRPTRIRSNFHRSSPTPSRKKEERKKERREQQSSS